MDYEKKYKGALEKARQLCVYPTTKPFISDLQDLFPELKESEDWIPKEIIKYLKEKGDFRSCWLTWLEKQKVLTTEEDLQGKEDVLWCIKQAKKYAKDENEMGTCWFAEKWLEKQGSQKPTWSEDDEKIRKEIIKFIKKRSRSGCDYDYDKWIAWLEKQSMVIKDTISMNINSETKWDDIYKFLRINLNGEKVKLLIIGEK